MDEAQAQGWQVKSLARRRRSVCTLALVLTIFAAAVPLDSRAPAVAAGEDEVAHGIAVRDMFGLDASPKYVAALLVSDEDAGSGLWGFPMTKDEIAALDIEGRETCAHAVQTDLLPFAEKLSRFGGAWIDQKHGGRLVIGLTKVDEEVEADLMARAPSPSLGVKIVEVDDSYASLRNAYDSVQELWPSVASAAKLLSYSISERDNWLEVGVPDSSVEESGDLLRRLRQRLGVDVAVVAQTDLGDRACDGTDRYACWPLRAGNYIHNSSSNGHNCSMGFLVNVPDSNVPTQFLTSGHCSVGSSNNWLHDGTTIGSTKNTSLYHAGGIDVMRISINDGTSHMSRKIFGEPGYPYDIYAGALSPVQGEYVCTSLGHKDKIRCGDVAHLQVTWWTDFGGFEVTGADMDFDIATAAIIDGDSGSPVYVRLNESEPNYRAPMGIVDHEVISCKASEEPHLPHDSDCGHDVYVAVVAKALSLWGPGNVTVYH